MTDDKLNIHQRINAIMASISYVQKGDAKVNGQYSFVSHDAVTAAIHPLLVEHGVNIIPTVTAWNKDGNLTSVDVAIDFVNIVDPADKVTISTLGYGIDNQDKGVGKAISYACKYAMLKVFMLETGDDPEKDLIEHKPAVKKKWNGPLVKTKLDAALRDYLHQVNGAENIAGIDQLTKDYKAVINQARIDDPISLDGNGKDHRGIIAEVTKLKDNFKLLEDQLRQPKEI
jgi:hypothetical protein